MKVILYNIPDWLKNSDYYELAENLNIKEIEIDDDLIAENPDYSSEDAVLKTINIIAHWGVNFDFPFELINFIYNNKDNSKLKENKLIEQFVESIENFKKYLNLIIYSSTDYMNIDYIEKIAEFVNNYPQFLDIVREKVSDILTYIAAFNGDVEFLLHCIAHNYDYIDEYVTIAASTSSLECFKIVETMSEIGKFHLKNSIIHEKTDLAKYIIENFNVLEKEESVVTTEELLDLCIEKRNNNILDLILKNINLLELKYSFLDNLYMLNNNRIEELFEKYPDILYFVGSNCISNFLIHSDYDTILTINEYFEIGDYIEKSAMNNNEDVFENLIELKPDPEDENWTYYASGYKNKERLQKLREFGYSWNAENCLIMCSKDGSIDTLKYILENLDIPINWNNYEFKDVGEDKMEILNKYINKEGEKEGTEEGEKEEEKEKEERREEIIFASYEEEISKFLEAGKFNKAKKELGNISIFSDFSFYDNILRFYLENLDHNIDVTEKMADVILHQGANKFTLILFFHYISKLTIDSTIIRVAVLTGKIDVVKMFLRYGFRFDDFCLNIAGKKNYKEMKELITNEGYEQSDDNNDQTVNYFISYPFEFYRKEDEYYFEELNFDDFGDLIS